MRTVIQRSVRCRTYPSLRGVLLGAALALFGAQVSAQTYPDKPIRLIVAFAAGGLTDTLARTLQPRLVEGLGQQIIIENRGGAGGTLAEAQLAKSAPDGYTILMSVDSVPANPHLFRNLGYDMFRDLVPVSTLAAVPLVLVVHPGVPVNNPQEFVTYARSGQKINYGSPGTGTSNHLNMEYFRGLAGIDMTHVPYKGGGPAMTDLLGGQVQALLISVTLAAPHIRSGKLRALGVAAEKRSSLLPQVPTFGEGGFPSMRAETWNGLFVPTGTSQAIVQRLHTEFGRAIRAPEVEARFRELGAETVMNSQAEFTAQLRSEHERLGKLIRDRKISAD